MNKQNNQDVKNLTNRLNANKIFLSTLKLELLCLNQQGNKQMFF